MRERLFNAEVAEVTQKPQKDEEFVIPAKAAMTVIPAKAAMTVIPAKAGK